MVLLQLRSLRSWLLSSEHSFRETLNSIFWLSCLLGLMFVQFRRLVVRLLRLGRVKAHRHGPTVQHLWNICFYASATLFLLLYQALLIRPEVMRETGKYFPQYINAIFATACDPAKFEIVTVVLVSYRVLTTVTQLSRGDYSVAFSGALNAALLLCCFALRLENYSILLNLYLAVYGAGEEAFLLAASRTVRPQWLTTFALLKCGTWIYLFLNLLPFEFLIPTLYARRELLPLKVCYWLWYCSCVWNSPLLKLLYHKIYHLHPHDCAGGGSAFRCILSDDWQNFRHFRNLQQAYLELKLHESKQKANKVTLTDMSAKTAYQTIKCVLTLKRKLKRMRENRASLEHQE
ncbi:uncharacterized protein LOC120906431 [Anopheles arabiensis]|uniref:TLC domain-containing protein n=1 Tax=Anopheles arabiensis TaxID=7173 RepID=A0A182HMX3_ANOAR|nr:uncharacterized protein LOC120906431 [Anopheles arabiensis]